MTVHTFPLEKSDYKGTITFEPFSEPQPDINSISGELFAGLSNAGVIDSTPDNDLGSQTSLEIHKGGAQQTLSGNSPQQILTGESCVLYLPQGIQIRDGAAYDNFDLGVMGATAARALDNGSTLIGSTVESVAGGINSMVDAFSRNSLSTDVGRVAVVRVAQNVLSDQLSGAVRSSTRVTVNPNTRALFKSIPLREFAFSFKMIPTSAEEAEEIKRIIRFFREELYPEEITLGTTGIAAGYKFPNKFNIYIRYNDQDVATKILPCYIKDFSATYNGSSMGFHSDGNFTDMEITMSFIEASTLHKGKIQEGY